MIVTSLKWRGASFQEYPIRFVSMKPGLIFDYRKPSTRTPYLLNPALGRTGRLDSKWHLYVKHTERSLYAP